MPRSAAALYFFTRYVKQAGAQRKLSAVPWRAEHGGMTSDSLAWVPLNEMWVKIENWQTPQKHLFICHYMRLFSPCQGLFRIVKKFLRSFGKNRGCVYAL